MSNVSYLTALQEEESKTISGQAKFKPSEIRELDQMVEYYQSKGARVTRSSLIRALVLDGLSVFKEEELGTN